MYSLFRTLIDRFKAFFMMHAILEMEADLIVLGAERKADLLRRADEYEQVGQKTIAQELRRRAETLSIDKPLGSVQIPIAHLQAEPMQTTNQVDSPSQPAPSAVASAPEATAPAPRKKKS